MRAAACAMWVLAVAGCAPEQAGQQVGQSLYDASVNTGRALANFGDQTGAALQNAGTNLRNTFSPPAPYSAVPPQPVYAPDYDAPSGSPDMSPPPAAGDLGFAPRAPVEATPLN